MVRRRACDGCTLRKIRCRGGQPCHNCVQAGFECSFLRAVKRPGPKGPRAETYRRINQRLQGLREQAPRRAAETASSAAVGPAGTEAISPAESAGATPALDGAPSEGAPRFAAWPSRLPLADVVAHLEHYKQQMYPVWPVVDTVRLQNSLIQDKDNLEIRALAFALCAATCAQLQHPPEDHATQITGSPEPARRYAMADIFAMESENCRAMYDYRESTTFESVLVPLFLHFYSGAKKTMQTASLFLRESLTLCQHLGLDKEQTYQHLSPEDERYRRRTFWLLYVTERGHAIQHGLNTCLTDSIRPPTRDFSEELQLVEAFDNLVGLFISVEDILLERNGRRDCPDAGVCSKETLSELQNQLRQRLQWSVADNVVQRTDIAITQQWLRVLLWQLSLKNIFLSSASADESMRLTYPVHVARDAIEFISTVPLDTLVAHGPGMEIKLFEITTTLLDVIHCVPSLLHDNSIRTQDILHHLCYLLSSLSHKPFGLEVLQTKLDQLRIPSCRIATLSLPEHEEYPITELVHDEELDS